jgi:3-dehydroshikimate dehydratase
MIVPGLVSITFRQLDVRAVVELAAESGLQSIEWGGDVHVPVGDLTAAKQARAACADAGLQISSYGSYIRVTEDDLPFDQVLETAIALGAPSIRVWAGRSGSADATPEHRRHVATVIAQAADAAAAQDVTINLEYHRNTLTDTAPSALKFLDEVASQRTTTRLPVRSYYQSHRATPADEALKAVHALREHLVHVHVFSLDANGRRLPLAARADLWQPLFAELATEDRTYHVQLEHVAGDDPAQLQRDAAALLTWLDQVQTVG